MGKRRLEFTSGSGGKFWEAEVVGRDLVLRWGKLGTEGQTKTKAFKDPNAARSELDKVAASKLKKGYAEARSRATSRSKGAPAKKAPAKKAPAKKAPAKKASAKQASAKQASAKQVSAKKGERKAAPSGALCFTREQEEQVERGWPHLRFLDDAHPDDAAFEASLRRVVEAADPHYHLVWPTRVARAFVRMVGSKKRVTDSSAKLPKDPSLADVVSVADARAIVEHLLSPSMNYEFVVHDTLYLLEAMVGADTVAELLVGAYERMPAKVWKSSNPHDERYATRALGYILLRCSPKIRQKLRARINELLGSDVGQCENSDWLRLIVGGKQAALTHHFSKTRPLRLDVADFVDDDPDYVLACALEKVNPYDIDLRYVALAGPHALEALLMSVRRMPKHALAQIVEGAAPFASEFVVGLYLLLWDKKPLKDRILAWCREHREFAAPILSRAKSDPAEAARIAGHFARKLSDAKRSQLIGKEGAAMQTAASELLAALATKAASKAASKAAEDPEAEAERRFDELSARVAQQLGDCAEDEEAEVLAAAREEYASIRSDLGVEPEEGLVQFFAVDGCGFGRPRKPAFARVKRAKSSDRDRWCELLVE